MKQLKQIFLVIALMMISNVGWGQTTIGFNGAETSGTTWTTSSNSFTASSTNTGTPADRIKSGTQSFQKSNGYSSLVTNSISTTGYSNCFVEIWTASISANGTNGADNGDNIKVYVSQTSSFGATPDITIDGTSNVRYGMSGSGDVTTTAGTYITYDYPTGGTKTGTDAKSKLIINIPSGWTTVYLKIESLNNDANEIWCIDDIALKGTLASGTSTVTAGSGSEPATLSSLINTEGAAVLNFDFLVTDDGSTPLTDGLETKISQIVINQGTGNDIADWTQAMQGALLTDGTNTQTANVTINATNITISSIANALGELGYIADDGTKTYTLKIWLKSTLGGTLPTTIDGLNLVFGVNNSSFTFNGGSTLAASQDVNSGSTNNAVSVESTKLKFVMQPTNTNISAIMNPAVTIEATDANNNRDLDKTGTVSLSSTGTMTGSVTATLASGFGTFGDITHTAAGTGLILTASLSGIADATSNTFNISIITPGLLLFEENFDYTNGTNLTSNGWASHSGTGTNPIKVHTSGLTYSNYGSTDIGNSVIINNTGEDINRTFTQQNSGSTTYCAFLVNVTTATTGGDYILHLGPTTIGSEFRGRFFTKSVSGNLQFGISTYGNTVNYSTTNYVFGTTYLIVIKHYFDGTSQTSSLFINPSLTTEPTPDHTETSSTSLSTNIGSVAIRQNSASNVAVIDGIRVGTGWGAVLGNPSYSSADNINAGNYNNVSVLSGDLTLLGNVNVNGTLNLNSGKILLGNNNFTISSGNSIAGTLNSSNYIVTNGTGVLKINNVTALRLFPVGTATAYSPAWISNSGTVDNFSVRVEPDVSGSNNGEDRVKLKWDISEDLLGNSNVTLKLGWLTSQEGTNFANNRSTYSKLHHLTGGAWVLAGSGVFVNQFTTEPYTTEVEGITSFSPFATGFNDGSLPVTLSAFNSNYIGRNIKLNWTTASETNNSGFEVERVQSSELRVKSWEKIGYVQGHGTVNTPTNYSFEDKNLQTGKYKYRLKQIDHNGNYEYYELNGEVEIGVPKKYDLSQNYPNPFNPVTKINFDLPVDSKVTMLIYDITGREVAKLLNGEFKKAGYHTTDFIASSLSSGVYFYSLSTDAYRMTKKMVVLK